jgi:cobalt/nickel transport system permease protein
MPAALALFGATILALVARLPLRWYAMRLGAIALLLAPFVVSLPLLLPDRGGSFLATGLTLALLLAMKGLTIVTLMLVLLATAPLDATLKAAHALHIPGLLVQLAMLTYRYVFVLGAELHRLRIALRVRGYRNRASRHSYRTVGHVAGTLLVRSVEQAERVGQAMRCRGFDGRFRSLTTFRTSVPDVVGFFLIAGSGMTLLLSDILGLGFSTMR